MEESISYLNRIINSQQKNNLENLLGAKRERNDNVNQDSIHGFEQQVDFQRFENFDEDDDSFNKNGRWSPQEHFRFLKGCLLFGNNWKKVNVKLFRLRNV